MADTWPTTVDPKAQKDEFYKSLSETNQKQLKFPNNLDEIDHWVCFRANNPKLFKAEEFEKKNDLTRIFLPMPGSIGTTYDQKYNNEGIGEKGRLGAGASDILSSGSIESIVERIGSITKKDIGDSTARLSFDVAETAAATAGFGDAFKGAVAAQGISKNPYMAVMYDSPNMRSHQFSWKFIARNRDESKILTDIVSAFKFHSAPGINGKNSHFLDYPEQFDIDFNHGKHLYNIGPSVLTSFNVQYHAEGRPLYYDISATEKAPVSVNISATFQEVAIVTKETIAIFNR